MSALLSVDGLTVAFGRNAPRSVVDRVSYEVAAGETVALVGESGSGKSVTALALMGLLPETARITAGTIRFDGRDLSALTDEERRRIRGARIGMIFQEPMTSLNPVLPIGLQVCEALEVHRGLGRAAAWAEGAAMLAAVGIDDPERRMRQYPHEFSGGMRQRVMIAAAMAPKPDLLVADEPTTALDVTVQAQILDLMRDLARRNGTSLLIITHDMGVVAETADRVVVLRRGRIVETSATRDLFAAPREDYTRALLAAVPRLGAPSRPEIAPSPGAGPALRLTAVSKTYGDALAWRATRRHPAVDGVSLAIAPGETLALVGESGSGKSTVGRIAARLVKPDAGTVEVDGTDVTRLGGTLLRRARRSIQMIFQDPYASLDPRFTIGRTIAEPMSTIGGVSPADARAETLRLLDRVGLPASAADLLPHQFSGGQRQRVAIARALAARPSVIVADEPTSALDVSIQAQILDLLLGVQAERGLALLFITHDLAVVRRVAHRVAVLWRGRCVELGPTAAVLDDPSHPYTAALLSAVPVPDPAASRRVRLVCPDDAPRGPLSSPIAGRQVAT